MPGVTEAVRAAIAASRASGRDTIARWVASAEYRAATQAFADCSGDDPWPVAERAHRLLADGGWARGLLGPLVEALRGDSLFEPPFKASRDRLRIGAVLFDHPLVSITACVTGAAAMQAVPAPEAMVFSGRVAVTRYVRAGGATLRRWRAEAAGAGFSAAGAPPALEQEPLRLADGEVRILDGRCEAQLLADAARDVVTLVATVRAGAAPLMREHAVEGGALLRIASADDRSSRTELLLAFLRHAGRAEAGPRFEAATRDPAFQLRWAAMREWLALDARAALPRLEAMAAADPHGEVRAAAAATLPIVRRRIEAARCPG